MASPPVRDAVRVIRDEYLDLPGLSLTLEQMQRLFRLDALTCESVTAALVDLRFLARNSQGRYLRLDHPRIRMTRKPTVRPLPDRRRVAKSGTVRPSTSPSAECR
jgi:hypothetical protein